MRTKPFLALTFLVSGCGMKPITIASPDSKVMADNKNPTVDNWNKVQTVGSTLDVALRRLQ